MFEIVKELIDDTDPCGFFDIGAPINEYDIESREIADRISSKSTVDEIAFIIYDVFSRCTRTDFQKEDFIEIAFEIRMSGIKEGKIEHGSEIAHFCD